MSSSSLNRRQFVKQTAALGAIASVAAPNLLLGQAKGANARVRVGIMGLGRGRAHVAGYLAVPNVEIAYLCDVDSAKLATVAKDLEKFQSAKPKTVTDFREILNDPEIDAISIAAPNYWHTPAAILACKAGKHVYVEKPGSHNAHEAQLIVAAARKYNRNVQMGNQRRSYPAMIEAIAKLREGAIGKIYNSRSYYTNARSDIKKGIPEKPPETLNYELWQGPTPDRPYQKNLVPYGWHWVWHYGGGEMANNGPHMLDIVRWGLGVDHPKSVVFNGGRYHFDDDQETPDTGVAVYDFGHCGATLEISSCHARKPTPPPFCEFYGDGGMMTVSSNGYTIFDNAGKEVAKNPGKGSDVPHFTNFINSIRLGERLNSEIEEAQKSSMLCHLANIAYRSGKVIQFDGKKITNPEGTEKLWRREYRPGWEPTV
ncbi:MAG: ydgJ 3 [Verrucomicrobia bacterium]|jgi:predicted dehydrogenase|nr:ydgJ 3 [Verrucomicrobiota bacterium]